MTDEKGTGGKPGLAGVAEILISRDRLRARVTDLAVDLERELDTARDPVLIGVLKGSTLFLADLVRAMRCEVTIDFMSISSYQASMQPGVVKIVKDLDEDISGRDVVLVEDIVDTGFTLTYLRRALGERRPRSLRVVTLLDKSVRRIVPVPLEHSGFDIGDVFVVGYGMDFQGRYRNVPDLLAVRDLARLANDPLLLVEGLFATQSHVSPEG
jgi:hypoxanthine phosphoribosyltransferase